MVVGINPVIVEWWWGTLTRGLIRGVQMMAESNTDRRHDRRADSQYSLLFGINFTVFRRKVISFEYFLLF